VRRATSPGRYGTGTSSTPIPDDGGASNVDSGSSSGGGGSTGGSTGGSGGGGDSGIVIPPTDCNKKAWGNISQAGGGDPTLWYCENTIGTITWTRDSTGTYIGTSAGLFPEGRTWLDINKDRFLSLSAPGVHGEYAFKWIDVNTVQLQTFNADTDGLADDLLQNLSFEIRTCCDTTPVVEECCEVDVLSITPIIE